MLLKPKCKNIDITTIRTSPESHLHWKKRFHKNPIFSRIYAVFEANNEIDISSIGNERTNINKQNPLLNGYYTISELKDVFKKGIL